jgi:Eisosome protein 1
LKLARAQDLPSFPSQGGVSLASAGAAASLAESNQKTFEHWKPGKIPAANKAAMQAKDYEMDPLWHPEMSRAGSKAAILAHRNTKSPDAIYTPLQTTHGQSAAGIAQSNNFSPNAITSREPPMSDHRKALMAATGAMSGSRRRADSAPIRPQTQPKPSNWALQAATSSHRAQTPTEFTTGDPGFEASRIQNMAKNNVNRQMYGSAPPVSIEVQEKNRSDMLRASAVAMARKMYAIQQIQIDEARGNKNNDNVTGARVARNRAASDATNSVKPDSPNRYVGLEEAARKLAQERLARIHDEHAEYRQYYGAQTSPRKSKLAGLSMRNRRGRASSYERDSDDSDEEQSRKIRSQMSIFQSKLAEVDGKKRQADRDALLDAAHKNVTKQMNAMDEKVFKDTGKTSPQQRELWERQARERAQRDSDERMINVGKVHIGGGKYLDQSEIDAIARARLQPTLDDITEKAEKQRARDEEIRLEQERQKAEAEKEKQRQREIQQGIKENQRKSLAMSEATY